MKENKSVSQKMLRLLDTASKMQDVEIYDVELHRGVLRVFIEHKTLSVDLTICEKFMRSALFLLESEGMENVQLEVSSPGLERKLTQEKHFQSAVGKEVRVYTNQLIFSADEKKRATVLNGHLEDYKDQTLKLNDGQLNWIIPLNLIKKAHTVFINKKTSLRGN